MIIPSGEAAVFECSTTYDAYQTDRRLGAIVHKITHASESNTVSIRKSKVIRVTIEDFVNRHQRSIPIS